MSHTPGDWRAERDGGMLYVRTDSVCLALLDDDGRALFEGLSGTDADGRLMAASKQMLAALKNARQKLFYLEQQTFVEQLIDPAIALAEE